jgi:hypothetical protein
MFATVIRFQRPRDVEWEELRQLVIRRAFEVHRRVAGLRSSALVFSPEREEFGGNHVWETQDDAEAYLRSDVFKESIAQYGEPTVLERAELCAYVEQGDLVFPPDYHVQRAIEAEARATQPH